VVRDRILPIGVVVDDQTVVGLIRCDLHLLFQAEKESWDFLWLNSIGTVWRFGIVSSEGRRVAWSSNFDVGAWSNVFDLGTGKKLVLE